VLITLYAQSIVQCILYFVFLRLMYPRLSFSLDVPFLIAPSVFANVYVNNNYMTT